MEVLWKILDMNLAAGVALVLAILALKMAQDSQRERVRDLQDAAERRAAERAAADANFAQLQKMYQELAELHSRTLDVVERNTQAWAHLAPSLKRRGRAQAEPRP